MPDNPRLSEDFGRTPEESAEKIARKSFVSGKGTEDDPYIPYAPGHLSPVDNEEIGLSHCVVTAAEIANVFREVDVCFIFNGKVWTLSSHYQNKENI